MDKLIDLNFTSGIRTENINKNFDLINDWLERERMRIGGYGIVEGFDLSADLTKYIISVSDGFMVSQEGEELHVKGTIFPVGPLQGEQIEETIRCTKEGLVKLSSRPYSPDTNHYVTYQPPDNLGYPQETIISVKDMASNRTIQFVKLLNTEMYLNADTWGNHTVKVTYYKVEPRIDSIILSKEGTYRYQQGIVSTSPSHVDMKEVGDGFLIGVAYWDTTDDISVKFFTNHRYYRRVFIDKDNQLYLNGKLYQETNGISFTEPEDPVSGQLWYSIEHKALFVWEEENGSAGWHIVNDFSTIIQRQCRTWIHGEDGWPQDDQTFLFSADEINLQYTPGINSVEVVIDNIPLMVDQFDEIVEPHKEAYLCRGIGIKLKDPLDPNAEQVQVIVNQQMKTRPSMDTFQRAAIFIAENYAYYNSANDKKLFKTTQPYCINEQQLEVYLDGSRLIKDVDYRELRNDNQLPIEEDQGKMSYVFQIIRDLKDGQCISHRVSKYVWSYDHLQSLIEDVRSKADNADTEVAAMKQEMADYKSDIDSSINKLSQEIGRVQNLAETLGNYLLKTDVLQASNIPQAVLKDVVGAHIDKTFLSTDTVVLKDVSIRDFVQVFYTKNGQTRILIKNNDYELSDTDNGLKVSLNPTLMSSEASLYINGFIIGKTSDDYGVTTPEGDRVKWIVLS